MASNEIAQDWDLLLRRWRDILGPSHCYGIHNRLARHLVIWSLGCRNTEMRKENKTSNEVTCMADKLFVHGDAINLTSGVCDISRSKRIAHCNWRFTRIFIRVGIGVNMGVHGSDVDHWSESVPVMSMLHRTYRVTRLRIIYLLNTRQGVWEKITEKVSDTEKFRTAEKFRGERSPVEFRWNRKSCFGVCH